MKWNRKRGKRNVPLPAGDCTVPIISANIGYTISSDKTYYIEEGHATLPTNKDVITLVVNLINGKTNEFDNTKFSKEMSVKIN